VFMFHPQAVQHRRAESAQLIIGKQRTLEFGKVIGQCEHARARTPPHAGQAHVGMCDHSSSRSFVCSHPGVRRSAELNGLAEDIESRTRKLLTKNIPEYNVRIV
jgi:hypothetical protein